jgi:hypothetical protein
MNKPVIVILVLLVTVLVSTFLLAVTGASSAKQEQPSLAAAVQETPPPPGQHDGPPFPPPGGPDGQVPPQGVNGPGFHGPGGPEGQRPPMPVTLDKQALEKVEKFLKEYDPIKYKEVMAIKERDELLFNRIASDVFRNMQFMERMKKDNPEVFKCMVEEKALESSCHELLKSLKDVRDQAKVNRVREELRKNLSRMFDLRQVAREEKIKRIERDMAELKTKQELRKKNRDKIIELRLNMMMGGAEGLEW